MIALRRLLGDRRVRYVLAGGVAAVLYYAAFVIVWAGLGGWVPYLAAAILANLCTALPIYQIYRRAVFRATGPWWPGFAKYYVLSAGSLLCITVGLPLLVEVAGWPVLVAQAAVVVGSPVVTYQLGRRWAFRTPAAPGWRRLRTTRTRARDTTR